MLDSIRLSENSKRQIVRIKRKTGIENWNTVCRWAFCLSIKESPHVDSSDAFQISNVEMTWKTFTGKNESSYYALAAQSYAMRSKEDISLHDHLTQHISRGISIIHSRVANKSIEDLLKLTQ